MFVVGLTEKDLEEYSNRISDIWYEVGQELGFNVETLNDIKQNNPNYNTKPSLEMLLKWKNESRRASRQILDQAIENCRTAPKAPENITKCYPCKGKCIHTDRQTHTHAHTQTYTQYTH